MKLIYFLLAFCVYPLHSRPDGTTNSKVKILDDCEEDEVAREQTKSYGDDGHITFPGEHRVVSRMPERPKRLSQCEHNICEQVEDYPAELILSVMKRNKQYDSYFVEDVPMIIDRNSFGEDNTLCGVKQVTKYPETAVNVNDIKRTVINVDGYKQALDLETCVQDGVPCQFHDSFPNGYVSECKQRYMVTRLLIIDGKNQTSFDSFKIPSCCVCTYKKQ